MLIYKHCGENRIVKVGYVKNKQRYLCRDCGRTFREGDERERYSLEQKIRVIKLYTDGVGLRSIELAECISTPLLIHWIRNFGKMIREKIFSMPIPDEAEDIEILQ